MPIKFNPLSLLGLDITGGSTPIVFKVADSTERLALSPTDGDMVLQKDTDDLYEYDNGTWIVIAGKNVVKSIGSFQATSTSNGLSISTNSLMLHAADATNPGAVSTTTQTFSGNKTFQGIINADGTIDVSSGTLSIGTVNASIINIGNASATVNFNGTVNNNNVINLNIADQLITLNDGGGAGSASGTGIEFEEAGTPTGYVKTSGDRNSLIIKAPNTAGIATITPGSGGITLDQSSHNPVSITTANGLSISGSQGLSLALSSVSTTGALSSTDWGTFNDKANSALSNLTTTSINESLIPSITYDDIITLGTSTRRWNTAFVGKLQYNATSNIDIQLRKLYNSSGVEVLNYSAANSIVSSKTFIPISDNTIDLGSPGFVWANLYVDSVKGSNAAPSPSIKIPTGILYDSTNGISVNWESRNLKDSTSVLAINYQTRSLYDSANTLTVDWDSGNLTDGTNASVDWLGRQIISSTGTTVASWGLGKLDLNSNKIENLANGTVSTDAVNKGQLDTKVTGVTGDIPETSYTNSTDVVTDSSVTGLAFSNASIRGFEALLSVVVDATTDLFATYKILGIQNATGWTITYDYSGVYPNLVFNIGNTGQVTYTSTTTSGFVSRTMKFRASVISI